MRLFIARFRRTIEGDTKDLPLSPSITTAEQAWAAAREAAAGMDFPVEVVDIFPVTANVIEVELPPDPDTSDLYWPSIPDGLMHSLAGLYFLLMLHRYHH
jgi:hypothetical protein